MYVAQSKNYKKYGKLSVSRIQSRGGRPVGPGPDYVVEDLARTLSLDALPVSEQLVPGVDLAAVDAPGDELPGRVQRGLGRPVAVEGAYETQADGAVVVIEGVSSFESEATALVNQAVSAHLNFEFSNYK